MDGSMDGSAKRSHSQNELESIEDNGRQKRRNQAGPDGFVEPSRRNSPEDVVYRILCPSSKIGSVIGKGGNIIKSLRQETGAKIKIEDGISGVDERVIVISAGGKNRDKGSEGKSQGDENIEVTNEDLDVDHLERFLPSAQDALLKVQTVIVGVDTGMADEEEEGSHSATARLLVPHSQIGCLLGKGGKVIEQMRNETRAQIRIFPKEQLPGCALPSDELVQISGGWSFVKKALRAVSSILYKNPSKERQHRGNFTGSNRSAAGGGLFHAGAFLPQGNAFLPSGHVGGSLIGLAPSVSPLGTISAGSAGSWPYNSQDFHLVPPVSAHESHKDVPEEEFVIRILCPNEKVGSLIGRGGNLIRHLRDETRAKIKIEDAVPDSDDRVITVSSKEVADSTVSPTFEAVILLQHRIADLTFEKDGESTTTKLLVPHSIIGCLLGKGGSVIMEMRKSSKANIRISKDPLPQCALDSDELVQITGDLNVARDALVQIVTKLRNHLFKEHFRNGDVSKGNIVKSLPEVGYQISIPSMAGFEHRQEPRSPELYNHYRSSYGNPSAAWPHQMADNSGLGGFSPYGGALQSSGVFGRTGKSSGGIGAKVSGATLELLIPSSAVRTVIGKGGSNIAQIREMSGAKVKLHDGKPGATERIIEISGTPEQTQTAQSLLDAFLITAQSQVSGLY